MTLPPQHKKHDSFYTLNADSIPHRPQHIKHSFFKPQKSANWLYTPKLNNHIFFTSQKFSTVAFKPHRPQHSFLKTPEIQHSDFKPQSTTNTVALNPTAQAQSHVGIPKPSGRCNILTNSMSRPGPSAKRPNLKLVKIFHRLPDGRFFDLEFLGCLDFSYNSSYFLF